MNMIVREVASSDPIADGNPGDAQVNDAGIVVQCGESAVCIARVQPADRREMDAHEFVHG